MALKTFKPGETAKIDITVEEEGEAIVMTDAIDIEVELKVQNPSTGAETAGYKYKFTPGGGYGKSALQSASVVRVFVDTTESVIFQKGLVNAYVTVKMEDADQLLGKDVETYGPFLVAKVV